jgi:hypothetical protein
MGRCLKLKLVGGPHSRDKILLEPKFIRKKAFAGSNTKEKPSKEAKFDQTLYSWHFLRCLRAAQMNLACHMRPAGRVFETPVLGAIQIICDILKGGRQDVWSIFFSLEALHLMLLEVDDFVRQQNLGLFYR